MRPRRRSVRACEAAPPDWVFSRLTVKSWNFAAQFLEGEYAMGHRLRYVFLSFCYLAGEYAMGHFVATRLATACLDTGLWAATMRRQVPVCTVQPHAPTLRDFIP